MNERIKELAEQAVNSIPDHVDFDIPDVFKQKFAELIVKECVEQIINRERSDGEWYQDDIFKHFGVEE